MELGWTTNLACERHQVVLAEREDFNVLHNDKLVVPLVENRIIDNRLDVLLVPLREEQHGLRISIRRPEQALAIRVLTDALENSTDGTRNLCLALQCLLW